MRKIFLTIFLTCIISTQLTFASTSIPVYINNVQLPLSTEPIMKNGTILVPFRDIFEALDYTVTYNEWSQSIKSTKNGSEITLYIGSTYANVSGKEQTLSVAPEVINGTTMVPLRFVSEAAGYTVDWNTSGNTNYITIGNYNPDSVAKTLEYEQEIINNKAIEEKRNKEKAKADALAKERQEYQDYHDKRDAILDEYHSTWISKNNLINLHGIYATWLGDYISFIDATTSKEIFRIDGSPRQEFEVGRIYEGNGVRYQYIRSISFPFPEAQDGTGKLTINVDSLVFSVPDLKAQGVIE